MTQPSSADTREMGSRYEEPDPEELTEDTPIMSKTDGESIFMLLISGDKPRERVLSDVHAMRTFQQYNVQERPDLPWWTIECPHGGSLRIAKLEDFPTESTPSNCGRENCWIVFYGPKREVQPLENDPHSLPPEVTPDTQ
jgi:hypothetical protein